MTSSAPKLQPEPPEETLASPFCYAEAQVSGESGLASTEQAVEERTRRRESEAFERGRQAAEQQLRAAVDAETARAREQAMRAIQEFARERNAYYRRIEGEVVRLALAIARKVLHRESQLDPNMLAGIVLVTLDKLDAGTAVNLYVHPLEATEWRHYFVNQMTPSPVPEVHEDPAMSRGECRIETSHGTTEIGTESQLKEIETGLLDLLAERPDTNPAAPAASASAAASDAALEARR